MLVSSHVLSELEEMADDAVFLSRGRTVLAGDTEAALGTADGRRPWRVRALDAEALQGWLTSVHAAWRPDDDGVLIDVDGDEGAARLVRDVVAAGVPLVSIAPAGGVLEQAYLALDEERR